MIVYQLVYWLFPPSGETWFTGKQVEDWPYSVTPALLLVVLKLNDWINDKHKQTVIYLLLMAFKATSSHQWLDRKRCFLEIFRGTSGVCVCVFYTVWRWQRKDGSIRPWSEGRGCQVARLEQRNNLVLMKGMNSGWRKELGVTSLSVWVNYTKSEQTVQLILEHFVSLSFISCVMFELI